MSMTREEATELLRYRRNLISSVDMDWCANETEALDLALSALRPVSRERIEKVWRGEWVGVPSMGVYDTVCSKCGYCPGIRFWSSGFCPHCGAPMTDEAVEIVMERLEAQKDGSTTD